MTIRRILIVLPMVFVVWIAGMAGVMRISESAPAAVILFPSKSLIAALPADTGILNLHGMALVVANRPGMTRALYEAGALLVLPAGLAGCLPLTKELRARLAS